MKKFLDLIFESVPEEEEKESRPQIEPQPIKPAVINKTPQKKEVAIKEDDIAKNDVLSKPKSSFGIEVNTVKTRTYQVKNEYNNGKYESQPPMSPIFGVLKTNHENHSFIAPSITGSKSASQSKIGTVLSPIYGAIEINDKKDDIIKIKSEETKDKAVSAETLKEEKTVSQKEVKSEVNDEEYFKAYFARNLHSVTGNDFANRSLEDILEKPNDETYIANDDISLFDDEKGEK